MKWQINDDLFDSLLNEGQDLKLEYCEVYEGAFYTEPNGRIVAWLEQDESEVE